MLHKILMPSMGATMEEGVIIEWKVKQGDAVRIGDVIAELESDKSSYEFESPFEGVIRKILAVEGQMVPVQTVIAIIGDENEEIPIDWLGGSEPRETETRSIHQTNMSSVGNTAAEASNTKPSRIKISPRARKAAEKTGLDITKVAGSGVGGRIESRDIEKAAKAEAASQKLIPFSAIRKQINRTVTRSKQQIPHFYVGTTVDMTKVVACREQLIAKDKNISFNAFIAKATAKGLEAEPSLNVTYTPSGYRPNRDISIGLAVETPGGVVIAIIENVGQLSLADVSDKMIPVIEAARAGRFDEIKMDGASVTISNLGMYKIETFIPIIHPEESAILGIGSIAERAVVKNGEIILRPTMPVTVCADHRIADGAVVARFLTSFTAFLESFSVANAGFSD